MEVTDKRRHRYRRVALVTALVVVATVTGFSAALAERPAPGDRYTGKTSQRMRALVEITLQRRVDWSFSWRLRCDRRLNAGSHMLRRGYFSEPFDALSEPRVDRFGRFRDREGKRWGQGDELEVVVYARVAGRFTRGGRASGTLRLRASVRRILSGRVVTRCRAGLIRWQVRREPRDEEGS